MENLYDILGVNQNASDDEIKSAYKKLAIKWHPDRNKGAKEAEEKFKKINLAKEILLDKDKRSYYDRFGTIEGMDNQSGFNGFGDFGMDINDILNMFGHHGHSGFSGFGGFNQQRGPEPGETVQFILNLTLEEIFNGCEKEIEYSYLKRCSKCNGKGGDKETCQHCHGTGTITETRQSGWQIFQSSHPCPYCHGQGFTMKNKCTECNGQGRKEDKKKIKVNVNSGVQNGQTLRFSNIGCESRDSNGKNGDLLVIIRYNIDESKYKVINNRHVYELITIPYYDCILGTEIEKVLPSGKKLKFKIPECSDDGKQIKCSGYGINGGDYIFIIKIDMPKSVSDKEKDLLKNIKKSRKN